jgi:hypothetical protein
LDPDEQTALPHVKDVSNLKDALKYTESIGYIRGVKDGKYVFSCPLHKHILSYAGMKAVDATSLLTKHGYMNVTALCKAFEVSCRPAIARLLSGGGDWRHHSGVAECTIQVLFQLFVEGAIPHWVYAMAEAFTGRGRSDMFITCNPLGQSFTQRAAIELKFWRSSKKGSMLAIRRATYQVAFDGYRLSATERHVLIIDAQDKFWVGYCKEDGPSRFVSTGAVGGLRLGLDVTLPELPEPVFVTVHGFGWTGGEHSAHGSALLQADSSSAAVAAVEAPGSSASSSTSSIDSGTLSAASVAAALARAGSDAGASADVVFDRTTVDSVVEAGIERGREMQVATAHVPHVAAGSVCQVFVEREKPASTPPSPSMQSSRASSPTQHRDDVDP